MSQELYCGASKRCITPALELLPHLRALQDRHFGGVLDDIYLRVLALKGSSAFGCPAGAPAIPDGMPYQDAAAEATSLLIAFELDKVPHPRRFLLLLARETGVKEENILLTAVHTHTAPVTGDRPFEGPNNIALKPAEVQEATHKYEAFLEDTLLLAAREALSGMVPAKMGIGTGNSYINICRKKWYEYRDAAGKPHRKCALGMSPETPIDRTVYALKFETPDEKPLAFFINYPVHCCVLHTCQYSEGKLRISGDIAGRVSALIEKEYPGAVALWCSGAAGDINPILQNEVFYPDPDTGDVITDILPGDNSALLTVMANQHYGDIRRILSAVTCSVDSLTPRGCVEWSRTPGIDGDYEVRLQMIRLGPALLFGASGELYSSYARQLRALIPENHMIIINHVASLCANSGYILDDEALLAPEADLPGISHTNMKAGYFTASLLRHTQHMYDILLTEHQ